MSLETTETFLVFRESKPMMCWRENRHLQIETAQVFSVKLNACSKRKRRGKGSVLKNITGMTILKQVWLQFDFDLGDGREVGAHSAALVIISMYGSDLTQNEDSRWGRGIEQARLCINSQCGITKGLRYLWSMSCFHLWLTLGSYVILQGHYPLLSKIVL